MSKKEVTKSSGNVFEDLGFENSPEELAKADMAARICDIIKKLKFNQNQAAKILGVDQPKVSALMRGKLDGFSTERLFRFLNALDRDVQIVIRKKPASRSKARIKVVTS